MLRQMLVAVDCSVWSRCAAQHACDVARVISGRVTLLHVLETHESGPLHLEAAHALLRDLSLQARRPPGCLIVPAGRGCNEQSCGADGPSDRIRPEVGVAAAILAVADQLGADLIVMGLHGQGSPTGSLLGQVVHRVLLDACVPVQVVPFLSSGPAVNRWSVTLAKMASLRTQRGSARAPAETILEGGSAHRNSSITCGEHRDPGDSEAN